MTNPVQILDRNGAPIDMRPRRASMLSNAAGMPYDAADYVGGYMAGWNPVLNSPDGEINMPRDRIVARARDLARNDGWAAAAVTRAIDNIIGPNFKPLAKPDYRALAALTGNKAFDHVWAEEWSQAVSGHWRGWGEDVGRFCDSERYLTVPQMMRLAFRHQLLDGDALAMVHWLPGRVGRGGADYATAIQIIDPDRLSNPQQQFDQSTMRGGVEVDAYGVATAYWIRRAHQGDWFNAKDSLHWDRIPRETPWGRPVIVHCFDRDRAAQHRGTGFLTPVIERFRMLNQYDRTEIQAAVINSFFSAYIKSPFDHEMVEGMFDDGDKLNAYQEERARFHDGRKRAGEPGFQMLFPGEDIGFATANRSSSNYDGFAGAALRHMAAGTGLVAQQISQNWSEVNYTAYRSAMLEAVKTFVRRRNDFAAGFAQPIYCAFLEESMEVDDYPLPVGVRAMPDFMDARAAYSRATWMGPGKGYVDPVKEKQGAILGLSAGLSSLEDECAEQSVDWREVADRQAIEKQHYEKLGLPWPQLRDLNAGASAALPDKPATPET